MSKPNTKLLAQFAYTSLPLLRVRTTFQPMILLRYKNPVLFIGSGPKVVSPILQCQVQVSWMNVDVRLCPMPRMVRSHMMYTRSKCGQFNLWFESN